MLKLVERCLFRAGQIIIFFLPIILFDYSQKLSPLFPFSRKKNEQIFIDDEYSREI